MMNNKSILVTGGAGFIGSHVIRFFIEKYPNYKIINLDKLTYAGNLENLKEIENHVNYSFVKGDVVDGAFVKNVFSRYNITDVIHLAAESHVDRSISNPLGFLETNVLGTTRLLEVARKCWAESLNGHVFYHVSTDEVFGSLDETGFFSEATAYDPRSPYSASKASSDHFVRAYYHTYRLPVKISNCSNNYGPFQFPEKLIPLMINNIVHRKTLPVYGEGANIRDWLYVKDHVKAIDLIFHKGEVGRTYCVGGNNELKNIDLVGELCDLLDQKLNRPVGSSRELIRFVRDRAGHDQRYAIDTALIHQELGWSPLEDFESGMNKTIDWYLENENWLDSVTSGSYQAYYAKMYETI